MFRWLRNKYEQFKLDRSERALHREGKRKQAEAREKNDPALLEDWESNYADYVYADIRWSRRKLVSDALLKEVDELYLPSPRYDDKTRWDEEHDQYGMTRGLLLTPEAITELRSTIRKERRERRENVEWWVKLVGGLPAIITGLVGLIGAVIGLVSVLRHK